ncbi:hypothetical protein N9W57_08905 [Pseudomonadales bacterium]|nr:hypothetical protein [Pseudomonadales bacterium]
MLARQLTSLSEAKYLVLIIILLSFILGLLVGREGDYSISPSENISEADGVIDEELKNVINIINNKSKSEGNINSNSEKNSPSSVLADEEEISLKNIKRLLNQQVNNQMRLDINSKLDPDDFELKMISSGGGTIYDGGKRYFSVQIELIDDEGKSILIDITDPLPLLKDDESI